MKNRAIKLLSVILTMMMLLSCITPMTAVLAANRAERDIPIIWVRGYGEKIYSPEGEKIFPVEEPDGYIMDAVKDCLPEFFSAVTLGNVGPYKEKFLKWVLPLYENVKLDANGENTNGSYIAWNASTEWVNPNSSNCGLEQYPFNNDWRLDPYENADQLKIYIDRIKAATGSDEVNLYGRCEGATITAAYLDKYGTEGIHKVAINAAASNGNEKPSKTFSGKLKVDAKMGDEYLSSQFLVGDEIVNEYFWTLIDVMRETYGLEITVSVANNIIKRVINKVLPDVLRGSYGSYPGVWAMMEEEDYQDALDFVYNNDAVREEYSGMIEKIKNYHDNAKANFADNLLKVNGEEHNAAVFASYGFATIPLFADCDTISDGDIRLVDASYGATCTKWGKTLSDKYIENAIAAGKGKYISPDKMVDTSTCILPDTTWITKNRFHDNFPWWHDYMIETYFHTPGMTIDTNPTFPVFTVFELDTQLLVPMTEENCHTEEGNKLEEAKPSKMGFFKAVIQFFKLVGDFLSHIFNGEGFNFNFGLRWM